MALKKAKNNDVIDDFIAGADTKSESILNEPKRKHNRQKYLDSAIGTQITNELIVTFKKRVKGVYSLNSFLKLCLLGELDYFSNADIVYIYNKSRQQNITMGEFVGLKLGIIDNVTPNLLPQNRVINKVVYVSSDEKAIIEKLARDLHLSVYKYSEIKFIAYDELDKVLSTDDILRLNKEANEFGLDLKGYISIKIKG
ncbi:hypothetical protein KDE13_09215 [Campylobacter sp. faydin G-140]|uniref:hypothetical protein n=1 Tax=Campylobacter anatolicus TaxID=2829105 RepID=UPI001B9CA6E9|nr:hypothetical protein [Campylobacter anatolicus]MBR8466512.1 hypothetical protein [Campylobacter anatolicus]